MPIVAFDTLKLADRLEAGGFTAGQARAVSGAFADAMSGSDLATKAELFSVKADLQSDIASVRADLKTEIASVRADLQAAEVSIRADLKTEIASVRSSIAEVKSEILKWMFGAMAAQTAILLTVVKLMGH